MSTYDRGDVIQITGTFRDAAGALVNPTTVTFQIETPAGVVTTSVYGTDAQPTRVSTGIYRINVSIADESAGEGTWHYRWVSTGTGQATGEGQFSIRRSGLRIPPVEPA